MSPLSLEIFLGVLALVLLLAESFAAVPRRTIAHAGIAGLLLALVALICCARGPVSAPLAEFYRLDTLAIFYKALALVSTVAVLVLSLEYAPVINQFLSPEPERTREAGLGE